MVKKVHCIYCDTRKGKINRSVPDNPVLAKLPATRYNTPAKRVPHVGKRTRDSQKSEIDKKIHRT